MGHIANLRKSSNQLHNNFIQECFVPRLIVKIGPVVRSRDEIENVKTLQMDRQKDRQVNDWFCQKNLT